jgi:hypothetical protein
LVQRCIAERLVSADAFAVCASLIAANANKQRSVPNREWKPEEIKETATRAEQEYFATLDDAAFGAASPVIPKFISLYPIRWRNGAAQQPGRHEARALIAIEKARAASRLRALTGEERVARDLLAPAMAISSNPLSSTRKSAQIGVIFSARE